MYIYILSIIILITCLCFGCYLTKKFNLYSKILNEQNENKIQNVYPIKETIKVHRGRRGRRCRIIYTRNLPEASIESIPEAYNIKTEDIEKNNNINEKNLITALLIV